MVILPQKVLPITLGARTTPDISISQSLAPGVSINSAFQVRDSSNKIGILLFFSDSSVIRTAVNEYVSALNAVTGNVTVNGSSYGSSFNRIPFTTFTSTISTATARAYSTASSQPRGYFIRYYAAEIFFAASMPQILTLDTQGGFNGIFTQGANIPAAATASNLFPKSFAELSMVSESITSGGSIGPATDINMNFTLTRIRGQGSTDSERLLKPDALYRAQHTTNYTPVASDYKNTLPQRARIEIEGKVEYDRNSILLSGTDLEGVWTLGGFEWRTVSYAYDVKSDELTVTLGLGVNRFAPLTGRFEI